MKLSIIMPLCDVSQWLNKALESIPKRDDIEVIMIENGSTDDTYVICKKYCEQNKNSMVIHYKDKIGCAQAINEGYERAIGDYVLQLDGDDYLITEEINNIIDNELGADLVYFNMIDNSAKEWILKESNCANIPDHTSLIKRSFLGDQRMPIIKENIHDIGHGWRMFNELLKKDHTSNFTNKIAYHYNYPREGSLYWNATHGAE